MTINYDLSFGFQQDDEVAEEDLELTYSEKLDSVKSREQKPEVFPMGQGPYAIAAAKGGKATSDPVEQYVLDA